MFGKKTVACFLVLAMVICIAGCKKENSANAGDKIDISSAAAGTAFVSEDEVNSFDGAISKIMLMKDDNEVLPFNVALCIDDGKATAILPAGIKLDKIKLRFESTDDVKLNGKVIESGVSEVNLTSPVTLSCAGEEVVVNVEVLNTGLPSMSLMTEDFNGIDSKTEYKNCAVYFAGGDYDKYGDYAFKDGQYISADAAVKGRGWTSWYQYAKHSYTLKFNEKQEFLGLGANKNWVLAANFADRSLIRNSVANELACSVGMESVMDVRFVDLWLDGAYIGNYQLIEKIEIDEERVNITDFDEKLSPEETGFIIETNGHNKAQGEFGTWTNGMDADRPSKWQKINDRVTHDPISGDMFFESKNYSSVFNINKPSDKKLLSLSKPKQSEYFNYICDYMDKLEAAIKTREYSKAAEYLDMDAMAKWYIVEELSMNTDSRLHCSCYMYKDAGGKMKMGPVWDFDLGFGNGKYAYDSSKTYLDESTWFADLMACPEFKEKVKSIWEKAEDKISKLPDYITETSEKLKVAQEYNFACWSINDFAEHSYADVTEGIDTYEAQVDYLKDFTSARIDYMNEKLNNW